MQSKNPYLSHILSKREPANSKDLTDLDNDKTQQKQLHLTTRPPPLANEVPFLNAGGMYVPTPDGGVLPVRPPYQRKRDQDGQECKKNRACLQD